MEDAELIRLECDTDDTGHSFLFAGMENNPKLHSRRWKKKSIVHRKKNKNKQNQQADQLQQGLPVAANASCADHSGIENQDIECLRIAVKTESENPGKIVDEWFEWDSRKQ